MARLGQLYGEATYVGKDQAWDELAAQVGDPDLLDAVGRNPLPASIRIKLRPELLNYPAMEEASRQISEFPEVEDVRYGGEWVRRLDEIGIGLKRGAIAVGLVVALAILFVMYNTIRLTVLARRSQVLIMSRLGASDAFIAMPFVIEAVMQAALAALLALGAVFGFQQAFISQVVHVSFLPWTWALVFLGVTAALASLAAGLSLSRVIRKVGA
jgi:cell division transport system permease protein